MLLRSRSSVVTNGENPPPKKKKSKKASPDFPHTTISSLPDDLVLSCLARVSRVYYLSISLVSKKFRSLITSPEIYEVRSRLGLTESSLYICLGRLPYRFYPFSNLRWFNLYMSPEKKNKKRKNKTRGSILVPVRFPNYFPQTCQSNVVAIGSSIYFIGGFINRFPCSNVLIFDCLSHTWQKAPDMLVARGMNLEANVIDGKIYVVGGGAPKNYNSSNWIEVFDPKSRIWNYVSSPGGVISGDQVIHSTTVDGKLWLNDFRFGLAYNPKDDTCESLGWEICEPWDSDIYCSIDNVLFTYDRKRKVFKWYDNNARLWRNWRGIERVTRKIGKDSNVELADYGGKMVVLWDRDVASSENKFIWCAVIAIERRDSEDEILGAVEWFDVVLTVPVAYKFVHVLTTTL